MNRKKLQLNIYGSSHVPQQSQYQPPLAPQTPSSPSASSYTKWKRRMLSEDGDGSASTPATEATTPSLGDVDQGFKTPTAEALVSIVSPSPISSSSSTLRRNNIRGEPLDTDTSHGGDVRNINDDMDDDSHHRYTIPNSPSKDIVTASPSGSTISTKSFGTNRTSGTGISSLYSSNQKHSLHTNNNARQPRFNAINSPSHSSLTSTGAKSHTTMDARSNASASCPWPTDMSTGSNHSSCNNGNHCQPPQQLQNSTAEESSCLPGRINHTKKEDMTKHISNATVTPTTNADTTTSEDDRSKDKAELISPTKKTKKGKLDAAIKASPPVTAKSARSFWMSRMNKGTTTASVPSSSTAVQGSVNTHIFRTNSNGPNTKPNSATVTKNSITTLQSEASSVRSWQSDNEDEGVTITNGDMEQSTKSTVSSSTTHDDTQDHSRSSYYNSESGESNKENASDATTDENNQAVEGETTGSKSKLKPIIEACDSSLSKNRSSICRSNTSQYSLNSYQHQQQSQPHHSQKDKHSKGNEVEKVNKQETIGEMQIKLDIAEAKCLTLEMKHKDVEETLLRQRMDHEKQAYSMQHQITQFQKDEQTKEFEVEQMHKSWLIERTALLEQQHKLQQQLKVYELAERDPSTKTMGDKVMNEEWAHEKDRLMLEITKKHDAFQEQLCMNQDMLQAMKDMDKEIQQLQDTLNGELDAWTSEKEILVTKNDETLKEKALLEEQVSGYKIKVKNLTDEMEHINHTTPEKLHDTASKEMEDELQAKEKDLSSTKGELNNIRKELTEVNLDFRDLAEETHRLEKELEVVTEDRDELLRRSVAYGNSMTESPMRQHKASPSSRKQEHEIRRLRKLIQEHDKIMKKKDKRIVEFEHMLQNSKAFDLDVSGIDLDSESACTDVSQKEFSSRQSPNSGDLPPLTISSREKFKEKLVDEQQLKVLQISQNPLCNSMKRSQDETAKLELELEKLKGEKNTLKIYVHDVVRELNHIYGNQSSARISSTTAQIKELRNLLSERSSNTSNMGDSDDSREDLDAVVECLETSTNRSTSGPSIECTIKNVTSSADICESSSLCDELVIPTILKHMNHIQKILSSEGGSHSDKEYDGKENAPFHHSPNKDGIHPIPSISSPTGSLSYDDGLDALESNNADFSFNKIRDDLIAAKNELSRKETLNIDLRATNFDLRRSLQDTMSIAKPLKEFILRTDEEKARLQSELSSASEKADKKEFVSLKIKDTEIFNLQNEIDDMKQQLRKTDTELREKEIVVHRLEAKESDRLETKEAEIVSLRSELQDLRKRLEASEDLLKKTQAGLESTTTPKKSNRSRSKSRSSIGVPRMNEQEDKHSSGTESEVSNEEFKKIKDSEVTLKELLRDSSHRLGVMTKQAEDIGREKSQAYEQIKVLEHEKRDLKNELVLCQEEVDFGLKRLSKLEYQLSSIKSSSNDTNEATESVNKAIFKLSDELSATKSKIKEKEKSEKKLKQSLEEAVAMLNSLRTHVEVADKERKRIKKQLKKVLTQTEDDTSAMNTSAIDLPSQDATFEDATTILHLKSHIVEMEHEIRTLEDRLAELETSSAPTESTRKHPHANNEVQKLEDKIAELNTTYISTKSMLKKVSDINKELLKDLRQTESEEAEALEELEILKVKLRLATEENDNAKYIASTALRKFGDLIDSERDSGTILSGNSGSHLGSMLGASRTLIDIINNLSRIACSIHAKNDSMEEAIEEKDKMVRNLLGKMKQMHGRSKN